jgi:hypothetical protein
MAGVTPGRAGPIRKLSAGGILGFFYANAGADCRGFDRNPRNESLERSIRFQLGYGFGSGMRKNERGRQLRGLSRSMSDGWVDLCRVQCIQAIERMLNARRWARLFLWEQNPEPISYFRTDCGVVV